MLDGWRGVSILVVLACHMLPMGPKRLGFNEAAGVLGMSLFFSLSGFLITATLVYDPSVYNFVIRRMCRIVPLAWGYSLIALPLVGAASAYYLATLLFYANILPFWLGPLTSHLWSVCMEMQFYIFVAILFLLLGRNGLVMLVPFSLAITAWRIIHHTPVAISTLYRVDEILAGAFLALVYTGVYTGMIGRSIREVLERVNPWLIAGLLLMACHPTGGPLNYLRPYLASALVGTTIFQVDGRMARWLQAAVLAYVAEISYALYVIHPLTYYGWLGSGSALIKYSKRPLSFALTFGLAHLSTRYYESRWIAWGKRLTVRGRVSQPSLEGAVSLPLST